MLISKIENFVLPQGWSRCCLPDFTDIVMGQSPTSDTYNKSASGIPFFQGKAEFGAIYPTVAKYCSAPNKIALSGATLLSVRAPVGPTNLAKEKCCIGRGLAAIHPAGGISPMFVLFLLRSIETDLSKEGTGSTFSAINKRFVEELEFGLPPLNEQYRIVAKIEELFSKLDKGIENLKTAQAQLKVYRQALLKHAFEGKLTAQWREERRTKNSVTPAQAGVHAIEKLDSRLRGSDEPLETAGALQKRIQQERAQRYQQQLADWEANGKQGSKPKAPKLLPPLTAEELAELPELPDGWWWFAMGDICQESILGKMLDKEKNKGQLKPYLRNINVRWGRFDLDDLLEMRFEESEYVRFGLVDGDLVICEGGEPGRCAVWRKELGQDMQIQKALHRVRFTKSINSFFVQMYFELCASNRRLERMFTGTTIKHLTGEKLARMAIPICAIDEQVQILLALESKFSEIDQLELTIATSLQQAEALRQSILKKAFSGQLVPQDPHDEPASVLLARIQAEREKSSQPPVAKGGQSRSGGGISAKRRKNSVGYKLSPTEITPLASVNKEP